MKKKLLCQKFVLLAFIVLSVLSSQAQEQYNITSSRDNNYCNGTCTLFDVPALNGNPTAVIFVNPVEVKGINLNPHPICAYYTRERWSVMNVDNSAIPPGAQFSVQYYARPDNNHFVHIVTKENLVKSNSYIDHSGLNGNPNAQFQFFQNAAPNIRGGFVNKSEIKIQYDAGASKWYISNINGSTLDYSIGYNIFISSGTNANTNPVATSITPSLVNTTPFVPGAKVDNSGQRVFMTVVGFTQGQFAGENNSTRMEVTGFEIELVSPTDAASGQVTGKRPHLPILIQKATGPASMQFFNANVTNENLTTVTFEVYKPSASGANMLDYKISLTNAHISSFKQTFSEGQKGFIDLIKIVFKKINLNNGGIIASDEW